MDWDDDEEEEDSMEEEEDDEEDDEELFARIEQAFRTDRARIRACEDLQQLRAMRAENQAIASNPNANQAVRIRSRDLVELVDDRITDVKARHLVARSRG